MQEQKTMIDMVKEFHEYFNHPVLKLGEDISPERRKLRLKVIFEELTELAEAYGMEATMKSITTQHKYKKRKDTLILDHKEALDALTDLDYVVQGSKIESGFYDIANAANEEVHNSNMTKACKTIEEAERTVNNYEYNKDESVYIVPKGDLFLVQRKSDNKTIKSINYQPVNFAKFFDDVR